MRASSTICPATGQPGENPDLEIAAFLADVGFPDTPALAGSLSYEADDGHSSTAMLQAYVPGAGDAWSAMLAALGSDPPRGVEVARRIVDLTARLHRALASRPHDPAFPARPATVEESDGWRASGYYKPIFGCLGRWDQHGTAGKTDETDHN